MLLAYLKKCNDDRKRDGFTRFQQAVLTLPPGAEGHVWIRMPINLGDVVMALPSILGVRQVWEAWAESRGVRLRFTLMGKRSVSLFQEAVPDLFAAIHVDEDFPASGSPLKLIRHWGQQRPLAVINYSKSDRLKMAAWLARVPVRAGNADGANNWCYQFSHPYEKYNIGHRVFRYLPMTRWLAGRSAGLGFELMTPERFGGASVRQTLLERGWDGGPYVVFGALPTVTNVERRWYPVDEPWIRLAALARKAGVTPVLAGGPEHREELERLAGRSGCLCLAGRTSLPQLLALTANAIGTIAVDTGIAHLAAATGKPTVVIFGPGLEYWDLPCGPKVVALRGNPAGQEACYPIAEGSMLDGFSPWSDATSRIPAERAWGILNYLAGETGERGHHPWPGSPFI